MDHFKALETIPILRIYCVEKAKEFYVDFLGFTVDWEHRFDEDAPVYMQVSRGGCTLHLSEHHGDASPGSNVFVRVQGLKQFHAEIASKGYKMIRPGIEETFRNSLSVVVTDPFYNKIQFDEERTT